MPVIILFLIINHISGNVDRKVGNVPRNCHLIPEELAPSSRL